MVRSDLTRRPRTLLAAAACAVALSASFAASRPDGAPAERGAAEPFSFEPVAAVERTGESALGRAPGLPRLGRQPAPRVAKPRRTRSPAAGPEPAQPSATMSSAAPPAPVAPPPPPAPAVVVAPAPPPPAAPAPDPPSRSFDDSG